MLLLALTAAALAQEAMPAEYPDPSRVPSGIYGDSLYRLVGERVDAGAGATLVKGMKLRKLDNSYSDLGAKGAGVCLAARDQVVTRVYLHRAESDSAECPKGTYGGELPFGLAWGLSSTEVEERLGPPYDGGGWGEYWRDWTGTFVHVAYDSEGLSALEIGQDGWVPPDVKKWFDTHKKNKLGQLTPKLQSLALSEPAEPAPAEEEDEYSIYNSLTFGPPATAPKTAAIQPAPALVIPPARTTPAVVAPTQPTQPVQPAGPTFPSLATPARTGAKVTKETAVVIGLEDYPFLGSGVPSARRDADAFDDLLVYTRGVPQQNIQTLKTGAREQILTAIERAAKEAGKGGTVWVYFAGHGAANPQSGERMLLGDDVRADLTAFASRGVGVSEIERVIGAAGAKPLLVLDTCYAGAGRSGASIVGGTRLVVPAYALAPAAAPTGGAQWNAASPDQISGPLPGVDHGAFTYYAVGAVRGWADGELDGTRDGKVTAAEAQAYVSRALRRVGKNEQRPVYVGPDDLVLSTGVTEVGPAF